MATADTDGYTLGMFSKSDRIRKVVRFTKEDLKRFVFQLYDSVEAAVRERGGSTELISADAKATAVVLRRALS
jgi:hypothetical protein